MTSLRFFKPCQRLRQACTGCPEPSVFAHTPCRIRESFRQRSGPTGQLCTCTSKGSQITLFQRRSVLLLLYTVGQGPAVLAAGSGQVGYIFYIFHLSSLSNVLSFGRWLNMTEILWFWLLNSNGSCQLLPGTSSLSTG